MPHTFVRKIKLNHLLHESERSQCRNGVKVWLLNPVNYHTHTRTHTHLSARSFRPYEKLLCGLYILWLIKFNLLHAHSTLLHAVELELLTPWCGVWVKGAIWTHKKLFLTAVPWLPLHLHPHSLPESRTSWMAVGNAQNE